MRNHLLKELLDDADLRIDEYVVLRERSLHMKLQLGEVVYFYIVSGCTIIYEFDSELNSIGTSILAPGQLLKIDTKRSKTTLIESIGSFDEDMKFLKIKRKNNVE